MNESLTKRLAHDNRGAVMLTGLFMSFFLVGSLWFVMGVGDAAIFRDRMQEAADHAAFSSAALHAKGMNFISACNLIMLVMVIVHIVLGIIHDFALAACILTLGTGCGGWVSARRAYEGYSRFMKPVLSGIHIAETVAAYGYPWLGTIKGYQVGGNYGNQGRIGGVSVFAVGPSNIPGAALGGSNTGLPVGPEPMNFLCEKVVGMVWDFGKSIAESSLSLIGQIGNAISGFFGGETIMDIVRDLVATGIKLRYCNDMGTANASYYRQFQRGRAKIDEQNNQNSGRQGGAQNGSQIQRPSLQTSTSRGGWSSTLDPGFDRGWGSDGPMVVNGDAGNGTQKMFVWAMNFGPKYRDDSEKKVTLAKGPTTDRGGLEGTVSQQGGMGYFAQAEFYYNCDDKWGEDACNGDQSNASFAIKWKARLRRLDLPNLGSLLANFGVDRVLNSQAYQGLTGGIEQRIRDFARGPLSAIGLEQLNSFVSDQIGAAEGIVRDAVTGAASTPTGITGAYH
jgi:hypothetical protein